jgi:hypothetical protein
LAGCGRFPRDLDPLAATEKSKLRISIRGSVYTLSTDRMTGLGFGV